jgi:hypothetical protein
MSVAAVHAEVRSVHLLGDAKAVRRRTQSQAGTLCGCWTPQPHAPALVLD